MALFLDVCRFTPTGGGVGDWSYFADVTGYQRPTRAGALNGALYKYRAESADLTQWELGEGAYDSALNKFARTTVLYNSAGTGTGVGQTGAGTKINFTLTPQVAIVLLNEDLNSALVGLGNVNNTSDANKPVSTAQAAADAAVAAAAANATNLTSGTVPAARLPVPSATTLGGVKSLAAIANNFLTQISTDGSVLQAQPAFSNLSGNIAVSQMNSGTGASATTFWCGDSTWKTPPGRIILGGNLTLWVRSDGSDSNNGLSNNAGGAKLTLNGLVAALNLYDTNGFTVTLKNGTQNTYPAGILLDYGWVGGGQLIIDLNGSNISETVTKGILINEDMPGLITIQNSASAAVTSISNANPAVVTYANTFAASDPVQFTTTGTLPSPLVANRTYFIKSPTGASFNLSLSPGGAAIATTTNGAGTHSIIWGGVVSSSGFAGIQVSAATKVAIGAGISFGACFDSPLESTQGATLSLTAPINVGVSGTGGNALALTALGGIIGFNSQAVNIISNQTYSKGTIVAQSNSNVYVDGVAWNLGANTVTGPRFYTDSSAEIFTNNAGDTFIPGSTPGGYGNNSGGVYDATMGINILKGIGTISAPNPLVFQAGGANAGVITSAGRWGFGTTNAALTPTNTSFLIGQNVTIVDAAMAGLTPLLHLASADSTLGSIILDGFGNQTGFGFRKAGGTAASKTAVTAAPIGSFFGIGWDTSVYGYGPEIDLVATETWSATAHGSGFKFYSVVNGTTTQVNSMTLQNSGCLTVGSGGNDNGAGNITATGGIQPGSFTVATLPAGVTGKSVWCSNCRVFNGAGVQEGGGAGTGGWVTYNSTAWKIAGTNVTAIA